MLLSSPDCPSIRIISRSDANIEASFPLLLRSAPHSIVVADNCQGQEYKTAFQDVYIVFHDGTDMHAQDETMELAAIDAAKEAQVKHFVLCSVFDPVRTKIRTHQIKLA